jgi:hypothetical protein
MTTVPLKALVDAAAALRMVKDLPTGVPPTAAQWRQVMIAAAEMERIVGDLTRAQRVEVTA